MHIKRGIQKRNIIEKFNIAKIKKSKFCKKKVGAHAPLSPSVARSLFYKMFAWKKRTNWVDWGNQKIQYMQDFTTNYQQILSYPKKGVFGNDRVRICSGKAVLEEKKTRLIGWKNQNPIYPRCQYQLATMVIVYKARA